MSLCNLYENTTHHQKKINFPFQILNKEGDKFMSNEFYLVTKDKKVNCVAQLFCMFNKQVLTRINRKGKR